jgi:hypothetical protein
LLGCLLGGLLGPSSARALDPIPDRWESLDPRPRNEFVLQATTLSDFAGLDIGYRRGLGRHFSLGALLEYAYPNPGYAALLGFAHTLEGIVWVQRPWTGVYFATTFTVGHQFLVSVPQLRSIALGGGAALGWSWDLEPYNLNLGFSVGLRRMGVVERSTQICTVPDQCIFVAEGFKPRFTLTFGYRF